MTLSSAIRKFLGVILGALPLLVSSAALSDASGPDFYGVIDVAPEDSLNMRTGPSPDFPVIGELPHNAGGVANLGCTGGLSLEEWSKASEAERRASVSKRWCLVGFERTVGWASGRFLAEAEGPDQFNAGEALSGLRGSEWRLTRLGDQTIEAEAMIAFGLDGMAFGHSGCNRFSGNFTEDREAITIGPLASTRMACPGELMTLETDFLQALGTATRAVSHHLVLGLLDDEMKVVAQFARTDWD